MRGWCSISNMKTLIISKGQLTSLIGNPLNYIDANDQVSVFNSTIQNTEIYDKFIYLFKYAVRHRTSCGKPFVQ